MFLNLRLMWKTLALPLLLALSACAGGGGPPFNSVPGTELYVGCLSDLDCPVELPTCRTHRFFVEGQTFEDNETLEVVAASQCTVPCGPDVGLCPDGIVTGFGGDGRADVL